MVTIVKYSGGTITTPQCMPNSASLERCGTSFTRFGNTTTTCCCDTDSCNSPDFITNCGFEEYVEQGFKCFQNVTTNGVEELSSKQTCSNRLFGGFKDKCMYYKLQNETVTTTTQSCFPENADFACGETITKGNQEGKVCCCDEPFCNDDEFIATCFPPNSSVLTKTNIFLLLLVAVLHIIRVIN
ncbi:uncharacterized protein [Clytia hemisphaerica]